MDFKPIMAAGTGIFVSAIGTAAGLLLCQKAGAMLVKDGQPPTMISEYAPAAVCLAGGTYLAATQDNEHVVAFAKGMAIAGTVKIVHTVANKTKADTLKLGLGAAATTQQTQETSFLPLENMFDLGKANDYAAANDYADNDDEEENEKPLANIPTIDLGNVVGNYDLGGIYSHRDKCVA